MRILFAGERPGFPQRMTGAAVSTHHLADLLATNGAAVHILCGRAGDAGIVPTETDPYRYTIDRSADPVAAVPALVSEFAPDVAILSAGASADLARQFGALGIPIVIYQRDIGFSLLHALLDGTDHAPVGVLTCSRFVAEKVRKRIGVEAHFLPNIFLRQDYAVAPNGGMVTLINPVPVKGVGLAFDLAARHRDLTFLFVEGWTLPPRQLAILKARASAEGNILWHPRVEDMRNVYARTRILLVPSRWKEPWGRVVSEAQISGIPVLASDHGGLPEAVGDGGVLLPPDDIDAWSACLNKMMADKAAWAELSAKAAAHARREELSPNRIVAEFICHLRDWLPPAKDIRAA
ncbi:glycosyltransferase [Hwanghaeella grinnelliae]|nr:glycosyltransferase [Hwanghaeella grinnelliae]